MLKRALTVYDIAKEAEVSPATVSRVLTGNANVSPEKKERIQTIINKYNFKPNAIARSLIKKESMMIGFILPDITNPFFASVFLEAENYAKDLGYTILLCNSLNDSYKNMTNMESLYLKTLVEKQVDGIILMGGRINETKTIKEQADEVNEILEQLPLVMINGRMIGVDGYKVCSDEKDGIYQLVDYLYRLGHRKFGFIGGVKGITSSDIKTKTLLSLAKEYGFTCKSEWCIPGSFSIESGAECMNRLLLNRDLPTAVLAVNDFVAAGALKTAVKRGYRIPGDLSITGFDDTYVADIVSPSITSVNHNAQELAKAAVDVIAGLANGKAVKKDQTVKTIISIRESCSKIHSD
jgi:DNA-binding LacI/PurR family transcriptional regulator